MALPSPNHLLGVHKYESWYPGQESVFRRIVDWHHGSQRFLGLSVAAGSGKSLNAILAAKMLGVRTCILTATKGLQDQYMQDVSQVGGVNVKGRNNFKCTLVPTLTCDDGPCHEGVSCSYRQSGCPYYEQLDKALSSNLVVTNYAYYLAQTQFGSGLGEFGLLVCDEGHLAFGALENHLGIHLSHMDVEHMGISMPRRETDWTVWQQWARSNKPAALSTARKLDQDIRKLRTAGQSVPGSLSKSYRTARSVALKLSSMDSASGRWVVEGRRHGWGFTPVWVYRYGNLLYQETPKVMLMSALLSKKTMGVLGVGDDYGWVSAGSSFESSNTPIYHISTTQVNHHADDYQLVIWLSRIDQIIQRRLDRKGIIFTVSYKRADLIVRNSRFSQYMMTHSTNSVMDVVRKFRVADSPCVLVSPSVTSGWDFPEVDYIIIAKVPYPDTTGPVMKARKEEDGDWPAFLAMETLINESARGTRSSSDKCEVMIVDDSMLWFIRKYRDFAPSWFMERYRGSLPVVPEPLI